MLSEAAAKELGFTGDFRNYDIKSICFSSQDLVWNKNKLMTPISNKNLVSCPRFPFHKFGKTLGFETTRYAEYIEGILYYYDDQKDKECKGYCRLDNLYMYYIKIGTKYVMHLTNGIDFTTLHFDNNNFYQTYYSKISKDVIQIGLLQNYQIGEMLGQGTFSKVYSAIKKSDGKIYAVKIIPKVDSTQYQTKHIVSEEKKIMRKLNSKRLCKMYEFYEDTQNYIFVLEYLTGQDLNKLFKSEKSITFNQSIFILKQILHSLDEIHKLNIIHRDLKPHNVVLNLDQKQVKLIDFGLSLIYDLGTPISKFMRCGTMGYIAPEVVNNSEKSRKRYDTKSDMYGFGIIAHMLLLGSNPLRGKNYATTVQRNMNGQVTLDKKSICVKYGTKCYEFLGSLLQKDPALRPTAQQALLNQFLQQKDKDIQTQVNPESHDQVGLKNQQTHHYNQDKQILGTATSNIIRDHMQVQSPYKSMLGSRRFTGIN